MTTQEIIQHGCDAHDLEARIMGHFEKAHIPNDKKESIASVLAMLVDEQNEAIKIARY